MYLKVGGVLSVVSVHGECGKMKTPKYDWSRKSKMTSSEIFSDKSTIEEDTCYEIDSEDA